MLQKSAPFVGILGYYRLERDAKSFVHDSRLLSEYNEDGRWDMTRRLDYPGLAEVTFTRISFRSMVRSP